MAVERTEGKYTGLAGLAGRRNWICRREGLEGLEGSSRLDSEVRLHSRVNKSPLIDYTRLNLGSR